MMPMQNMANGTAPPRIELVGGQPVIYIGDRIFALPAMNPTPTTALDNAPSNDPTAKPMPDPPTLTGRGSMNGLSFAPPRAHSTSPFSGMDLATLKAQQTLKKQELRQVEQTEVLQASHQTEAWRAGIIEKKRCLIVELDALRKSITALENDQTTTVQSNSFLGPIGSVPGTAPVPSFVPQLQQPMPQAMFGYPSANPYTPMMMYQTPYGGFPSFPTTDSAPSVVVPPAHPPTSPGAGNRRSHAVAIKPPQAGMGKPMLNPKSPTYEPASQSASACNGALPTPSSPKRSPWRRQGERQSDRYQKDTLSQKPSLSSIDTTDFFPNNTHEHSTTRLAPAAVDSKQPANDSAVVPLTPEKHWPASPWNEGLSGRSKTNESKLTSWPEAFGKQQSSSSLRQTAGRQPSAAVMERAPVLGAYAQDSTAGNNAPTRSASEQRTGTEENWPFSHKVVAHTPTTYQEGYQAGYDHMGMPDNPEVLQGYIQGLLHFLSDESKKGRIEAHLRDPYVRSVESRTPSLRGLVAGSMPHDSAVSMSFARNTGQAGHNENVRASTDNLSGNMRRDSACSPQGSAKDVPVSYALFNEAAYTSRQRSVPGIQYPNPGSQFSERLLPGRQIAFAPSENENGRPGQQKGTMSRVEAPMPNGGFSRQFSGAQLQNRGYGTPLSNQRFYPTPKELTPNGINGDTLPTMRPFADNRLSGLDGAMDDLADLVMETKVDDNRTVPARQSAEAPVPAQPEVEEETASCFKSSSKSKQKAPASPAKSTAHTRDNSVSSPNPPSSPKKSGEHSPTKAKIEHVTNKFRRAKKDDPRTMSAEDKTRRSEKWRQRFQVIKKTEIEEIEAHHRNTKN